MNLTRKKEELKLEVENNTILYVLMFRNIEVLTVNKIKDKVEIINKDYLPFGLRNQQTLSASIVFEWIYDRLAVQSRKNMDKVRLVRDVGVSKDKILKDSFAISIIDNFWVKFSDNKMIWDDIKKQRDINCALNYISLFGKITSNMDFKRGITSLFTLKGYYPKAIYKGELYKLIKDSKYEYPAYLIAKQINVDVAECTQTDEYTLIKLFTNDNEFLVHSNELKSYFNEEETYNAFLKLNCVSILSQFQRMFIFNYIIGNPDLHGDNYGVIYNDKFEFLRLAPCYDHNLAFELNFNGLSRTSVNNIGYLDLHDLAKRFILNHNDIAESLKTLDYSEIQKYLSKIQLEQLKVRVKQVIDWVN